METATSTVELTNAHGRELVGESNDEFRPLSMFDDNDDNDDDDEGIKEPKTLSVAYDSEDSRNRDTCKDYV